MTNYWKSCDKRIKYCNTTMIYTNKEILHKLTYTKKYYNISGIIGNKVTSGSKIKNNETC